MTDKGGIPAAPDRKASSAAGKLRDIPAAEVCNKPSNQIVSESGAVDYLNKEIVKNSVERLWDVQRNGDCSASGLTLVENWDHPSRNGEQGRGGGVPRVEAVLWGLST